MGQTCRPIPLVFVQMTKNDESKEVFRITHVSGINVNVKSKLVKKNQVTQYHQCQLYGHGQLNCHAAAVCVKCTGPYQTAECTKRRNAPAKCALCQDPHTANYKGCSKSPYTKKGEALVYQPKTAKLSSTQTSAAIRTTVGGGCKHLSPPCRKGF
ncbi:hypothetical protein Trydic_g7757 [Trypoxylus dichotomus]